MKYLVSIFILFALASCTKKSTKVDSNEIYQKYRVEYNESDFTTKVRCKIKNKKEGGAKIKFIDSDYIAILNSSIKFDGSDSYNYEGKYSTFIDSVFISIYHKGIFINNYFRFSDVNICSIPVNQTIQYHGYYWTFQWDGPAINGDEKITIQLYNSSNEEVYSNSSKTNGYTYLYMSPSEYEDNFGPGTYKMKVTREKIVPLITYTGSGGEAELVYIDEEYITFY